MPDLCWAPYFKLNGFQEFKSIFRTKFLLLADFFCISCALIEWATITSWKDKMVRWYVSFYDMGWPYQITGLTKRGCSWFLFLALGTYTCTTCLTERSHRKNNSCPQTYLHPDKNIILKKKSSNLLQSYKLWRKQATIPHLVTFSDMHENNDEIERRSSTLGTTKGDRM